MAPESIIRSLGDLEGTVRSLQKTVSDMAEQWGRQEASATGGRRALYERFDATQKEVGRLSGTAQAILNELAEMKKDLEEKVMPVVNDYTLGQARRGGFNEFGKLLWTGLLALVAAAGYGIHQIIGLLSHHAGGG